EPRPEARGGQKTDRDDADALPLGNRESAEERHVQQKTCGKQNDQNPRPVDKPEQREVNGADRLQCSKYEDEANERLDGTKQQSACVRTSLPRLRLVRRCVFGGKMPPAEFVLNQSEHHSHARRAEPETT